MYVQFLDLCFKHFVQTASLNVMMRLDHELKPVLNIYGELENAAMLLTLAEVLSCYIISSHI